MNTNLKMSIRYILPSVGGLFVSYLYNVVDGIFVGQGIGATALGAVNIGVPFITFVFALSAIFPFGAGVIVSNNIGKGDIEKANQAFIVGFSLTVILSVLLTVIGMTFTEEIIDICGGNNTDKLMRQMAIDYLFYYIGFSLPMLLSVCLSVFVRNDGSPELSFIGMCVGAVSNIILDWYFVFVLRQGVIGAAIASGLGQVFSVLILMIHFFKQKGCLRYNFRKVNGSVILEICKLGLPEACSQLSTPVQVYCYNLVLAHFIGALGISTFSVISFISSLCIGLLSGVSQGLQPLWARSYGLKNQKDVKYFLYVGLLVNLLLSLFLFIILTVFGGEIVGIFSKEASLVMSTLQALPCFAASFIFMGFNLIVTAYLFSTLNTVKANILAINRGIIIKAIVIFCVPYLLGADFIWYSILFVEIIMSLISYFLLKMTKLSFC